MPSPSPWTLAEGQWTLTGRLASADPPVVATVMPSQPYPLPGRAFTITFPSAVVVGLLGGDDVELHNACVQAATLLVDTRDPFGGQQHALERALRQWVRHELPLLPQPKGRT